MSLLAYLVAVKPNVEFSRGEPLRDAAAVDDARQCVQDCEDEHVVHRRLGDRSLQSQGDDAVKERNGREHDHEPEAHHPECSVLPPVELVRQ